MQSLNLDASTGYVVALYGGAGYAASVSPVTLGQNIKRLRERAGFKTQGALAKALNVPQPQVSDWENDRYDMLDTKTLMRLGKELKVSMDAIVAGLDVVYDQACQGSTGKSIPHQSGGVDVPAETRVRELQDRVDAYEAVLAQVRLIAGELTAAVGGEGDATARAKTRRSRRR